MDYTIREIQKQEYPSLDNFLYEAIFIPEGIEPPPKTIITSPELQVYVEHFGALKDDWGLVAEVDGKVVGAIWVRIMNDYGHIDDETPSLAISLYKEYRGFGIGTAMMKEMLALLKSHGYSRVSLSVQKANYAAKLYLKVGFEIVRESEEEYIMVKPLIIRKDIPFMRIRPYIPSKDYEYVSKWIDNERTHAFWCANLLPYPMTQKSFHDLLEKNAMDWTDSAYVTTEDNGQPIGFFCYSVNTKDNIGFLKFVMIDKTKRGNGYGKEMLNLALQYAFQITGAKAVQLNVFSENTLAKQCYEKVGFIERNIDKDVFSYQDELWSICNMIVSKQSF